MLYQEGNKKSMKETGNINNANAGSHMAIDPVVRALNTIMYGLVVHFGTQWMIEMSAADNTADNTISYDSDSGTTTAQQSIIMPSNLLIILFLHEYWVYLQHTNVLANPLLQHLDRQYGIALLKSNKHWAIAGTLSAYWARETLSMFLCLPYLVAKQEHQRNGFSTTQYMILYSLIYHTIKSRGVRKDALTRSSSKFGIMRLVIDKFYTHTSSEVLVTIIRLVLQGADTFIHYSIVRDLVLVHSEQSYRWFVHAMHVLFTVWVIHAALNQLFRCSTASIVVNAWHSFTPKKATTNEKKDTLIIRQQSSFDDATEGESISSSSETNSLDNISSITGQNMKEDDNDDYIVRQLLHHKRVQDNLKGRQGVASNGVDKAVRLETAIAILASFFMLGLGEVPLMVLPIMHTSNNCIDLHSLLHDKQKVISLSLYAWLLCSLLYGLREKLLKSSTLQQSMKAMQLDHTSARTKRQRSILHMIDLGVQIGIATYVVPSEYKWMILLVCTFLNLKALLQSMHIPKLIWRSLVVMEFVAKLATLRLVSGLISDETSILSSLLSLTWAAWVVSSSSPTPCEVKQLSFRQYHNIKNDDVADAVFLGHPALLSDCWALWLLPYSLKERWQAPSWSLILWPFHYLVGLYLCKYRSRLFGDSASFFCSDDNYYGKMRMQNWVASHFGRHFVTHPRYVKDNIEATAGHAEKIGVKVLCLGALNKAESINGGGLSVAKALGPKRRLSIIHGNHLTAAAVVETIHQCFGDRKVKLFLTGASSKVGWAVAQALRDRYGYNILCHSTDEGRRKYFEKKGFTAASTLAEGMCTKYWVVGKFDSHVAKLIPQNATAIVFSVPHPLESRPDCRVIEAGTLHMDLSRLDRPRMFTNKLKEHEIFACHAASVVACHRLEQGTVSRIDEIGPVDPQTMDSWLVDAKNLGFSIPQNERVLEDVNNQFTDKLPVVIIGAGPSGLCTAAYLSQEQIPHVILEAEKDPNVFGSWSKHFTGLEITTQKKWCNLPGLAMSDSDFPNETVTAKEYQQYLKQYVQRYGINICRGVMVKSVEKGTDTKPYIVKYHASSSSDIDKLTKLTAWAVIDATGKHRTPTKNSSEDLTKKMDTCGIAHIHSTEMCNDANWEQAIQAAQNGSLCMVGLGNSSADIITAILQQCQSDSDGDDKKTTIHVSARTVPPVFPRRVKFLRIDTVGYFMRVLPLPLQDLFVKLLWWGIPNSKICNSAFPSYLKRWEKIGGRVPVIDKYGMIASGFESGLLLGHGPISAVTNEKKLQFCDNQLSHSTLKTSTDMVIFATGYQEDASVVKREDRLNGLYKCGFMPDRFLPIQSIGEDARVIAEDISASYHK